MSDEIEKLVDQFADTYFHYRLDKRLRLYTEATKQKHDAARSALLSRIAEVETERDEWRRDAERLSDRLTNYALTDWSAKYDGEGCMGNPDEYIADEKNHHAALEAKYPEEKKNE